VIQWLEELESIIQRSGCAANQNVIYVAGLFRGSALTWWNSIVHARGCDGLEYMSWPEFKELVLNKFCLRNEIQKLEQEFQGLERVSPPEIHHPLPGGSPASVSSLHP
jgi:hypothetical protein